MFLTYVETRLLTLFLQNDHLFFSQFHDPEDGYVYLEQDDWLSDGQLSGSSVIRTPKHPQEKTAKIDLMVIPACQETEFHFPNHQTWHTDSR